jgi:hypothetical protein
MVIKGEVFFFLGQTIVVKKTLAIKKNARIKVDYVKKKVEVL